MIVVGLTSKRHEGAVAIGAAGRLLGVCGDDRVTRERAGNQCSGWPAASLVLMLERLGHTEAAVGRWVVAGDDADARMPGGLPGTVEVIARRLLLVGGEDDRHSVPAGPGCGDGWVGEQQHREV